MQVYQVEEGQIGLTLAIVLSHMDLVQILGHNPLSIELYPLRINLSFCEPRKPVSFRINTGTYCISLGFKEVRCLKSGNPVVLTNMVEDVRFTLVIFFEHIAYSSNFKLKRICP